MHDREDLDVESPCKTLDIDSDFNPSTQTHTIGDLQAHTQIRVMNTAYIGHETKVSSESVIGDVTHMTNVTMEWHILCLQAPLLITSKLKLFTSTCTVSLNSGSTLDQTHLLQSNFLFYRKDNDVHKAISRTLWRSLSALF